MSIIIFNKLVFLGLKYDKKGVKFFIFVFKFCFFLLIEICKNLGINIFEYDIIVLFIVKKKGIFL